jgi:hypothetical protein
LLLFRLEVVAGSVAAGILVVFLMRSVFRKSWKVSAATGALVAAASAILLFPIDTHAVVISMPR